MSAVLNYLVEALPLKMHEEWRLETVDFLSQALGDQSTEVIGRLDETQLKASFSCRSFLLPTKNTAMLSHRLLSAVTIFVTIFVLFNEGITVNTVLILAFLYSLIVCTFIDFHHLSLPDSITVPLVWIGIAVSYVGIREVSLDSSIGGAIVGYLSLWLVYWLYRWKTGNEGLGYGDFKLFSAIGAWEGVGSLPVVIALAILIALVISLALAVYAKFRKQEYEQTIPFGPYLSLSAFITLFYGEQIIHAYKWVVLY
nr:A24 family peptidase [Vibrio sp. Y2-5]